MTAEEMWRRVCRGMRSRVRPALYRRCFVGTSGLEWKDGTLTVALPAAHMNEQLLRRFMPLLAEVAKEALRRDVCLRFVVPAQESPASGDPSHHSVGLRNPARTASLALSRQLSSLATADLLPHYSFQTFVAGDSNRLAFAAAQSVAAAPGRAYNPLFLYGGSGLGKTHLLMAIGHDARARGLLVGFFTAEGFADLITQAQREHREDIVRHALRAVDMLLVDDVQFIGGKEAIEEAFFHTFNALHLARKQIVLTSDRVPRAIPTLHDRLRSRFEWGLLADIATPAYADRLSITQAKAATLEHKFPPAVLEFIARPDGLNVRAIEGALNRLVAAAQLQCGKVTLSLAAATLREQWGDQLGNLLQPDIIVEFVANHFHVPVTELLGKTRNRAFAWPRQVAMFLLREETDTSLAQIGSALGGRDHTTIMHGCEQVLEVMRHNEAARHEIDTLRVALRAL